MIYIYIEHFTFELDVLGIISMISYSTFNSLTVLIAFCFASLIESFIKAYNCKENKKSCGNITFLKASFWLFEIYWVVFQSNQICLVHLTSSKAPYFIAQDAVHDVGYNTHIHSYVHTQKRRQHTYNHMRAHTNTHTTLTELCAQLTSINYQPINLPYVARPELFYYAHRQKKPQL